MFFWGDSGERSQFPFKPAWDANIPKAWAPFPFLSRRNYPFFFSSAADWINKQVARYAAALLQFTASYQLAPSYLLVFSSSLHLKPCIPFFFFFFFFFTAPFYLRTSFQVVLSLPSRKRRMREKNKRMDGKIESNAFKAAARVNKGFGTHGGLRSFSWPKFRHKGYHSELFFFHSLS